MDHLYIHGANATSRSFNYIREQISGNDILIDYHSSMGFSSNLAAMCDTIQTLKQVFVVGHSLGGVYALHLANMFPGIVKGAVTISTPYGGSSLAELGKLFMPHNPLFQDISPSGTIIRRTMTLPILHPWLQIVTIGGEVPWILLKNDGVVTYQSMRARPDMDLIELDLNHYEVMQSSETVGIIQSQLRKIT